MSMPKQTELREFVTLEKGKPPALQPYYGHDAEHYLTPEYLRGGASCDLVKPGSKAVRVCAGDTVLLWDGSNAGEVLYGRDGVLASTMCRAAHGNRFDAGYFYYALKRWEPYLKGQTSGSGIPHVDKEIFGRLPIVEFDAPDQAKIAEVLSTVDQAIEQTEALIAKQQRIKTGLMQDLLTRGIDEHGNLRSEATHRFRDSPLGRIPVEWDHGSGSNYFTLHAGMPVDQLKRSQDGNSLYVKVDDFNSPENVGGIFRSEYTFGCPCGLVSRLLEPRVLVFPKRGAAIFINRVELLRKHASLDPNLMGLRTKPAVRPEFFRLVLLHRNLGLICDNSGIPQINNKHLYPLIFAMPGLDEQDVIVKCINQSERTIIEIMQELKKLQLVMTGLMQDLLTGERRVTALLNQQDGVTV